MEKHEVLKKYFGYTSFKEGQEELVATNAFGMGIDKSNVRYVLLYSPQEVYINKFLIENRGENSELTEEQAELVLKNDRERLWLWPDIVRPIIACGNIFCGILVLHAGRIFRESIVGTALYV